MRIGIDIGGVIIAKSEDDKDTSFFSDNFLKTPMNTGAVETIQEFVKKGHQIFLISKAGPKTAEKTLQWLENRHFFARAGLDKSQLVFCREREDKAAIARLLELDVMVDDRTDICDSMVEAGIGAIEFKSWLWTRVALNRVLRGLFDD